ncbi:hypothetical protein JCM10213_000469 [Rhodosporidiobolus nylandii]
MSGQSVALPDAQKSVLSLLLSLSPLYFLISARSQLGLDKLHIGLLQVLLLVVLKAGLDRLPSPVKRAVRRSPSPSPPPPVILVEQKASPSPPAASPTVAEASKKRRTKHDAAKAAKKARTRSPAPLPLPPAPQPPFPREKLGETVANFLSITDPAFLSYLPSAMKPTTTIPSAPLSSWTSTYAAGDLEVLQHPSLKSLFGICCTYPEVPLRALYETLADVEGRAVWDSMTASGEELERFEVEGGRRANVLWMKMKGMAMVKAKDLVLLSVPGTFPSPSHPSGPSSASAPSTAPLAPHLRCFCATTSVLHPRAPVTPEFNRMELAVSGFVIEEANGGRGSRIVQIVDLNLGPWVPSAVLRQITQTLLPKSLIKLGAAAAERAARGPDEKVEFPPPVLGSSPASTTLVPPAALVGDNASSAGSVLSLDGVDESDEEDSDEEELPEDEDDRALSRPSSSRDLHALLTQLRSLTTRLGALEALVSPPSSRFLPSPPSSAPQAPSPAASGKRPWWSLYSSSDEGPGVETATLSEGKLSALFTLGSAAGAAVAVAAVAAWGRRQR